MPEYKLGEIRHGNEPDIGFKNDSLVIYVQCKCGKMYFTPYDKKNNRPRTSICKKCSIANFKDKCLPHYAIKDTTIRPFYKYYKFGI